MQVVWTEPALDGIALAYDYIFEFNPRAAMHVANTLRGEGDSLEHFPHRGRPVPRTNIGIETLVRSLIRLERSDPATAKTRSRDQDGMMLISIFNPVTTFPSPCRTATELPPPWPAGSKLTCASAP